MANPDTAVDRSLRKQAQAPKDSQMQHLVNYATLRGFNYQPSYGSTGLEIWRNFDAGIIRHELSAGKRHFPGISAIRLWLSHDAWLREKTRFEANFETALTIAADLGLVVMPVLFNRWHDTVLDYGGTYVDHFFPKASWVQDVDQLAAFTVAIVRPHANDPRIFAWDLCNEPYAYRAGLAELPEIAEAETQWLARTAAICRSAGARAPITVGVHPGGLDFLKRVEPFCDLLSIHPYAMDLNKRAEYESYLDGLAGFAAQVGKPLLATEAVWGALEDAVRVEILRYSLEQLKKRHIGWLAYLLHHSQIADAHREEFGPVGTPGNLSFIEADGTLRPGHEAFNDY